MKKAQAAMETLILVGFALALFIPLILLFFSATTNRSEETNLIAARSAVRSVADYASDTYLQGEGAKKRIIVNYPSQVANISISNQTITFRVRTQAGLVDISEPFTGKVVDTPVANKKLYEQRVRPELDIGGGLHTIDFFHTNGKVEVSYVG
jgi:hypothetical protein